jgi:anaerobic selenocysteine-containing dehydrogenase
MERRNFIKISALTSVAATLDACRAPDKQLIRFVPEDDLIPGIAVWKPSLCTLCSAGCGLEVRVMQGDAEVMRNGKQGVIKMGLAKKLEGSPQNPINAGKLCARGQAGLQVLYHPDRITRPIKRTGARGSDQFQAITWDEAIKELTSHLTALQASKPADALAFVARPMQGQRRTLIEKFLKACGAPPPLWYEPFDEAVLRRANLLSFGHAALPTLDLARADYVISFGADFLGTWNSPVAQSVGYGAMRRGRPGRRGKFVQVEPRMSQTGANADEWIACKPGTEGVLALGIAHVVMSQKLAPPDAASHAALRAQAQIAGWSAGLPEYTPEAVEKQTGVTAAAIVRLAHEITLSGSAAAFVGGAPLAQTNGLFTALAVNALESLVDTARDGRPILGFSPEPPLNHGGEADAFSQASFGRLQSFAQSLLSGNPGAPQMLMLYEANPIFSAPSAIKIREAMAKVPTIVSFGSFIDETNAYADLILPDHAPLESWLDSVPESGSLQSVIGVAPPAVSPLHETRAMTDVLLGVAQQLGGDVAKALPFPTFEAMLKATYVPLRTQSGSVTAKTDDDFWQSVQGQGGWWKAPAAAETKSTAVKPAAVQPASMSAPEFAGGTTDFPFYFLPYLTPSFGDGSTAHLPWMQELPEVLTTAMWSSWVEIHPRTGEKLGIQQGDLVEISSPAGSVLVPAMLSPGIAPDLVAMPVGQGHENFGRFASGNGANPLSILAPVAEPNTGALAWAATRVKLARVSGPEQAKLVLFAGGMSGFPHEEEPR